MVTGSNGILQQARRAKEQTEIAGEKEQLKLAMINLNFENEKSLRARKEIFQKYLDNSVGKEKIKVYIKGNGYTVHFLSSNHIYTIEENESITVEDNSILKQDTTPGVLDGTGTEDDYYVIMSIEDLVEWSKNYNLYSSSYIKLGRTLDFKSELSYCDYTTNMYNDTLAITDYNITLLEALTNSDYNGFKPIERFDGTFDGNNYSIKNLYVNTSEFSAGLFRNFSGKELKNFNLDGNVTGNGYVGGIIASITVASNIENCTFSGNIENISQEPVYQGTGGIAGSTNFVTGECLIKKCISKGNIIANSTAGGIIGYSVSGTCKIDKCINQAHITIGGSCSGGIIGQGRGSKISNSINDGIIQGNSDLGGISGYKNDLIINCYNTGNISGNKRIGGLVGQYYFENSLILNSYNTGIIEKANSEKGAIIGMIFPVSTNITLNNIFWYENSANKWIASGEDYATGEAIRLTETQLNLTTEEGLLKKLNNYVQTYNNQSEENKTYTDGEDLAYWKIDIEKGYPTLDI